jgi:hypothetical protein
MQEWLPAGYQQPEPLKIIKRFHYLNNLFQWQIERLDIVQKTVSAFEIAARGDVQQKISK